MISTEALKGSIDQAAKNVRDRAEEVTRAQSGLAEAERELRLLVELAEMRGVRLPDSLGLPASQDEGRNGAATEAARHGTRAKVGLLAAVIEILAERGEPMQIRELMAAVQDRDVPIPGRGQQANLIAHISRDPRIFRPRRGFYALREWNRGGSQSSPAPSPRRAGARRKGTSK